MPACLADSKECILQLFHCFTNGASGEMNEHRMPVSVTSSGWDSTF